MYLGLVTINQDSVNEFLKTAKDLEIELEDPTKDDAYSEEIVQIEPEPVNANKTIKDKYTVRRTCFQYK
jgi:hypothetical protein